MKKTLSVLLAVLLLASCGTALADYDKDIQFSGHTFGETLKDALAVTSVYSIDFDAGRWAYITRAAADPAYIFVSSLNEEASQRMCFTARIDSGKVAGYNASAEMAFYYPDAQTAAAFDLAKAVFYAGIYHFYEGDAQAIFEDLKAKLGGVYGTPLADTDNADEIWGPVTITREGISEEDIARIYQEGVQERKPHFVAWRSSSNGAMIVLVNYDEGGWIRTSLYYLDENANETILALYPQQNQGAGSDSLEGL